MGELNHDQYELVEILKEVERISCENNYVYYLGYGTALGAIRHHGFIPWDSDIDIIVKIDTYHEFLKTIDGNLSEKYEVIYLEKDEQYDSLKARIVRKDTHHSFFHIDVFPMVGAPKDNFKKKLFSKLAYLNYRLHFLKKLNPKINYKNSKMKEMIANMVKIVLLPFPEKIFIYIFEKMSTMYPMKKSEELYNICGSYGKKEFIPKDWLGNPKYMEFESEEFPLPEEWDKYLTHIYGDYMIPKRKNYI